MSDIQKIRLQMSKIKKLIQKERDQDKKTINKLSGQLRDINSSVSQLEKMTKRVKGGKIRGLKQRKPHRKQKAGAGKAQSKIGGQCPFIVEEEQEGGKKRRKKRKSKK